MNRCAFPGCTTPVIDADTNTILAEVCHIKAQNPLGPRFEASQTPEDRHGFENLMLMCGSHHKVIDAGENSATYTGGHLMALKAQHERAAKDFASALPRLTPELLRELRDRSTVYERDAVHMDFRNAVFRAGGEGGGFGGGGGSGGVITIVGWTRPPDGSSVALNGEDGRCFGAGGGGAGAIQYVGRPATPEDVASGLRLSSIFAANAVSLAGLFNVLGGGWSSCQLIALPWRCVVHLVCIVELGTLAPESLIRFQLQVLDPAGDVKLDESHDVPVPNGSDLVPRAIIARPLQFEVAAAGAWRFRVVSAGMLLADHLVEFRVQSPS